MQSIVTFENINNKEVFFSLTEPNYSQKKIVIMNHGFRGSSIGPARAFVDFERILVTNGISSLRFDQPNSGNSEGDYINSSFDEWVQTTTYFAKKYLNFGYQVILLGQSMGASTIVIATSQKEIKNKIPCLLLWVPDPKSTTVVDPNKTYEEGGQQYKGNFWQKARDSDFFKCLDEYEGGIHLVYGEFDKYVSQDLRNKVITHVKAKNQKYEVLPGQNHSSWDYDIVHSVYESELALVKQYFTK